MRARTAMGGAWLGLGLGIVAACAGGTAPVVVGGPGPSDDEPGQGTAPIAPTALKPGIVLPTPGLTPNGGAGPTATSSGASGVSVSSAVSSGSGGCLHCRDFLVGKGTMNFCPASDTKLNDLVACSCGANCMAQCSAECANNMPAMAGSPCATCVQTKCSAQLVACETDI